MFTPVYRVDEPKDSVADRQKALLGFTSTQFLAKDFLGAIDPTVGRAVEYVATDDDTERLLQPLRARRPTVCTGRRTSR